jgi:hypothetical protein
MTIVKYEQLLNSGSKDLTVNGSVTPVVFSYSPGSGTVRLTGISLILRDEGTTDLNKFGVLSALTNGLLMQYSISSSDYTLANMKDNSDVANVFSDVQHFGNSATLSILSVVTPQGWGNSTNIFKGKLLLRNGVILTDSDSIKVTVRDNISNVDHLEIGVFVEIET